MPTEPDQRAARESLKRHLHRLVEALDRRVPHIERSGEAEIAKDALELKARALKRLAELADKS